MRLTAAVVLGFVVLACETPANQVDTQLDAGSAVIADIDAGRDEEIDAGQDGANDAGPVEADAGPEEIDAGHEEPDAGTPPELSCTGAACVTATTCDGSAPFAQFRGYSGLPASVHP